MHAFTQKNRNFSFEVAYVPDWDLIVLLLFAAVLALLQCTMKGWLLF